MKLDYGKALKYPFRDSGWIKKSLFGALAALLLPLSTGYFISASRRIIQGDDDELPEWLDVSELFSQGIMGMLLSIIYILPSLLIILIGYLLIGGGSGLIGSYGSISFPGMILSIVVFAGILFFLASIAVLPMAFAFYSDSLDLMDGLKIKEIIKKIFDNIEEYCMALFLYICVSGTVLAIFIFIFPLALFYINMFYAHIFGQVYLRSDD